MATLDKAITIRQPAAGLVHLSDRGVQYASAAYVQRLHNISAHISISAKGNPYDNAKAEGFLVTLKREEVYLSQYETFADAESHIGRIKLRAWCTTF